MSALMAIEETTNRERFRAALETAYADLFAHNPRYAYVASKTTPAAFAERMVGAILANAAELNGSGPKRACAALGITCQQHAIVTYLRGASTNGR